MTTLPLAEVRAQLSRLVEDAERTHMRVEVTKNGRRAAVLLSAADYDSLIETLDILSEADEVGAIKAGEQQLRDGESFSLDEVAEAMRAAGRL